MIKKFAFITVALSLAAWSPAVAYEEIPVANGGEISGQMSFIGSTPDIPPIKVIKNPEFCGPLVWDPVLTVNPENNGLKNSVLYLEGIERGKQVPDGMAIDAFQCLFVPYTTVVYKGKPVLFHTNDTIFHNVHAYNDRGATLFNLALPKMGQVIQQTIKTKGVIRIQCDSHIHMNGWAMALDHPYFSVTDDKGRFRITDIPPGTYKLIAWHPGYNMTNRAAYEASLKTPTPVRPMYDEPHVIEKTVEIKAGERLQLNLAMAGR